MIGVGYLCFGANVVSYIERFVHKFLFLDG